MELLSIGPAGWGDELLKGLSVTLRLAVTVLPFGLLLGFIFASMSLSKSKIIKNIAVTYTTAMRGIPELLTLFIIYNGISLIMSKVFRLVWPEAPFIQLRPFLAGVIALGLVFGAFSAEVLRGAFQSLDKGQIEAAEAIGMSPRTIFTKIKLPQLWKYALPGLGNLWIILLKDTALVSIIALDDLMRMTAIAVSVTKKPFTFYLVACLLYWLFSLLSEFILSRMEKNAAKGMKALS